MMKHPLPFNGTPIALRTKEDIKGHCNSIVFAKSRISSLCMDHRCFKLKTINIDLNLTY